MVKEIVFHLGDCKTGTTSVQSVLAAGAWKSLRGDGGGDVAGDIVYPARVNHIPLAKTLSVEKEKPFEDARFSKVRQAFDDSTAKYGVISAEHFEFVDPGAVHAAIQRQLPEYADRVRLVAYVRPHADRLVSTFSERSKKGLFHKPLADMHVHLVQDRLLFYTPRFEKWRELFGDRFTLRPFVRSEMYKSDVVHDFFHQVFASEAFEITKPTDRNESLTVEDIAMMRAIHVQLRKLGGNYRPQHQAFGWYMSDMLGAAPYPGGGTKPALHKALAQQVVDTYGDDAAALDAAFFDATPMSDALQGAPAKAVDKEQSFQVRDHFNAAQRRQFKVWAQLLYRMMSADPAHFSWAIRQPDQRGARAPGKAGKAGKRTRG